MRTPVVQAFFAVLLFAFLISGGAFLVHSQNAPAKSATNDELIAAGLRADTATDPNAYDNYEQAIRLLFQQRNYTELDGIANTARANKEHFSGGVRKLTLFYSAFRNPSSGKNASEADWQDHVARLEEWKHASSNPLTASMAMAGAYYNYAWKARGDGTADTVSDDGWSLFHRRLQKVHAILDEFSQQREKDPVWYQLAIELGTPESLPQAQERALFDQAIAADPTFRPYYHDYAFYLRPQWSGEEGDILRLADEMYAKLGPVDGPIAYFEIATMALCNCGVSRRDQGFSVVKIKRGFALSQEHYGPNLAMENTLAFMAWNMQDPVTAEETLEHIGDNYVLSSWQDDRENIDRIHQWLASYELDHAPFQSVRDEMRTPEGQNYAQLLQADFNRKYGKALDACHEQIGDDARPTYFMIKQDATGRMVTGFLYPMTAFSQCFVKAAIDERHPLFIVPPHDNYWNKVVVQ